jgi:hypothetical protein
MDGIRRLFRGTVVVLLAGMLAGAAWVDPPPDVRGLSVDDARARLVAWNQSVTIQVLPTSLPAGVDPSTVVVAASTWLNPVAVGATVVRPQVRLTLGPRVPDLIGLTQTQAVDALVARGLRLRSEPAQPAADWVVTAQRAPGGTIVEFGLTITATFAEPEPEPETTTDRTVLVAVAAGGVVALLVLLAGLLLLRSRSRRRRPRPPAMETIEVRGHPGQVIGPELSEPGASVSIRLEAHADAGTLTVEEIRR